MWLVKEFLGSIYSFLKLRISLEFIHRSRENIAASEIDDDLSSSGSNKRGRSSSLSIIGSIYNKEE